MAYRLYSSVFGWTLSIISRFSSSFSSTYISFLYYFPCFSLISNSSCTDRLLFIFFSGTTFFSTSTCSSDFYCWETIKDSESFGGDKSPIGGGGGKSSFGGGGKFCALNGPGFSLFFFIDGGGGGGGKLLEEGEKAYWLSALKTWERSGGGYKSGFFSSA